MTKDRIDNAVEIIEYAIKNNISVTQASIDNGFAGSYVKNVKSQVNEKYENGTLDDELYDTFQTAYDEYLNTNNKNSNEKPNINIGVGNDFKEFGSTSRDENIKNNATSFKEMGDAGEISHQSGNKIRTVDDLLDAMGVDKELWEVKSKIVNSWDTTAFHNNDGCKIPVTHTNYQVKARLEKIKAVKDGRNVAQIFRELVDEYQPPVVTAPIKPHNSKVRVENNLLEINLFDLHIGKLGWAGEVGENYDTKIAVARFHDAMNNLLRRAEGFEYSRILFPVGNDFFNSDNMHNTTSNGTPQDEDLRWQKTFKMGCKLIVDGINMLKATGVPVDILVIPGNHDWERSYYLGEYIDAWFKDDEQVNIDNGANPRKYYEFGEVLIGLTHGKEEKENSLPLLMASEQKEAWGRTTFHEWHLGHFHKKRNVKFTVFDKGQILNEETGVIVRYLSSLSGTEEWHFKKGYVGSHKAGEAFVWNDEAGMIGHLNFNFTDFDREH